MSPESVVVNPRRLGPAGWLREIAFAARNGPEPETVFRLLRPFHGPEFDAIYARCRADPTARRLLAAGRSLQPALLDFERLRALPVGTLGREYLRFVEDNGLDIVSFAEASLRHMAREDYATEDAWVLANRMRDIHELIHVVSGYGTDVLGEMCELVFNLREDPRPKAAWFAVRTNIAKFRRMGASHAEGAIRTAAERGRRTHLLVGADWEGLLDRPLVEVRQELGVSPPPDYVPVLSPADGPPPPPGPRDLVAALFVRPLAAGLPSSA